MSVIKTALAELYGLFVEDASYAGGILVWLLVAGFVFPHILGLAPWRAPVLFVGMVFLLVENVLRTARKQT